MNYINCQHCGEYSALKSEYLTFCDHCGKKFPIIYKDWLIQHPEGNLDSYGLEFGISGEEFAARERRKERRSGLSGRRKVTLAVGIVCFLVCTGLSMLYGPYLMAFFREPKVSPTLLEADRWRTFRGNIIRMQSPLSLKPETQEDLPNMRKKAFEAGGKTDGIVIRMEEVIYLSKASISLEEAAHHIARGMETRPGISRFSYTSHTVNIGGEEALLQKGTYALREAGPMAFNSLVLVRGGSSVQLIVTHSADDSAGKLAADKIMTSVHLN